MFRDKAEPVGICRHPDNPFWITVNLHLINFLGKKKKSQVLAGKYLVRYDGVWQLEETRRSVKLPAVTSKCLNLQQAGPHESGIIR